MSTDNRIRSLSSILGSPARQPTRLSQVKSVTVEPLDERVAESSSTLVASSRPAKARQPSAATTDDVIRRVVARVWQGHHEQVVAYAHLHNISHGAVVLQAVEYAHGGDLLISESGRHQTATGLFVGAHAAQTRTAEAKVTLEIRLHRHDLAALDRLVLEHELKDRTDLINQALTHFLEADRA